MYFVPEGDYVKVGNHESCTILITGLGIKPFMCALKNKDNRVLELSILNDEGIPMTQLTHLPDEGASTLVGFSFGAFNLVALFVCTEAYTVDLRFSHIDGTTPNCD